MNGATYNQLVMFHTIVKEGSISQAARKLEIAPPSVSQALKSLEAQLGLPLFTRTTRKMELTEAGQLLLERTLAATSELAVAVESIRDLSIQPSGKVRLTTPRFFYQYWLKPIYADFCKQYPDIQLEISVSDAAVNIIDDGFDVGIRFGHKIEEGMIARPLTKDCREALFASPAYVEKHGAPKTLQDLQQHKQIQYRFITSNQLAPLVLTDNGEHVTVAMPASLIVNDTDLMVDAATKGLGIGRLVEPVVEQQLKQQTLIPILEQHWHTYPGMYVYFHQNTQKAKRVRVLIDFLVARMNG